MKRLDHYCGAIIAILVRCILDQMGEAIPLTIEDGGFPDHIRGDAAAEPIIVRP